MLWEKEIPKEPRFDYATQTAYRCLLEWGFTKFPISPFDVLKEIKDFVVCLPWSEARNVLRTKDPLDLHRDNSDGRTYRSRPNGMYCIVYDDVNVKVQERRTWTIMHEIGHIVLGHLVDFKEIALNHGIMNPQQYGNLEKEANYFVSEFLMPSAIIKHFESITSSKIALLFGVSYNAAEKKRSRLSEKPYFGTKYDELIFRNFFNFLLTNINETIYQSIYHSDRKRQTKKYVLECMKCPSCYSYVNDPNALYCPYCGADISNMYISLNEKKRVQSELANKPVTNHYIYPFSYRVIVNASCYSKLTICPLCLNHKFSYEAKYCCICGTPLINETYNISDCFSKADGKELSSNKWYHIYEKRYQRLASYRGSLFNIEWVDYKYWEFAKYLMSKNTSVVSMDLQSALLYSHAFLDDNDDIHIVTDTNMAAAVMRNEKNVILSFLKKTDGIERIQLEVLVPNDL